MKPLVRGQPTGMVEIPANWYLDDLPPHMFIVRPRSVFLPTPTAEPEQLTLALPPISQKDSPNSHGFVDADVTLKLWKKVALTSLAPCKATRR